MLGLTLILTRYDVTYLDQRRPYSRRPETHVSCVSLLFNDTVKRSLH